MLGWWNGERQSVVEANKLGHPRPTHERKLLKRWWHLESNVQSCNAKKGLPRVLTGCTTSPAIKQSKVLEMQKGISLGLISICTLAAIGIKAPKEQRENVSPTHWVVILTNPAVARCEGTQSLSCVPRQLWLRGFLEASGLLAFSSERRELGVSCVIVAWDWALGGRQCRSHWGSKTLSQTPPSFLGWT